MFWQICASVEFCLIIDQWSTRMMNHNTCNTCNTIDVNTSKTLNTFPTVSSDGMSIQDCSQVVCTTACSTRQAFCWFILNLMFEPCLNHVWSWSNCGDAGTRVQDCSQVVCKPAHCSSRQLVLTGCTLWSFLIIEKILWATFLSSIGKVDAMVHGWPLVTTVVERSSSAQGL